MIEKYEQADQAAKEVTTREKTNNAQWNFLKYVNENRIEAKKSAMLTWHKVRIEDKESKGQKYYTPHFKYKIYIILEQEPKKYSTQFFWLKVKYAATRVFQKMRKITTTK